jgi:predicted transport protein
LDGCDIIVCWAHDWRDCPDTLEVIELRNEIGRLSSAHPAVTRDIEKFIESRKPHRDIEEVFRRLVQEIEGISNKINKKIKKTTVVYKTAREFVGVELQRTRITLHLTLPKRPRVKGVEYVRTVHDIKQHCHLTIRTLSQIELAVTAFRKAYEDSLA